jgi:hypothetical protein
VKTHTDLAAAPADTNDVTATSDQRATMLLDATEAAAMLGIPVHTLRRYATLGAVPSIKFSRARNAHRFYRPEDIEALRRGGFDALDGRHNGNGDDPCPE